MERCQAGNWLQRITLKKVYRQTVKDGKKGGFQTPNDQHWHLANGLSRVGLKHRLASDS
jgi:hypothetical protein